MTNAKNGEQAAEPAPHGPSEAHRCAVPRPASRPQVAPPRPSRAGGEAALWSRHQPPEPSPSPPLLTLGVAPACRWSPPRPGHLLGVLMRGSAMAPGDVPRQPKPWGRGLGRLWPGALPSGSAPCCWSTGGFWVRFQASRPSGFQDVQGPGVHRLTCQDSATSQGGPAWQRGSRGRPWVCALLLGPGEGARHPPRS